MRFSPRSCELYLIYDVPVRVLESNLTTNVDVVPYPVPLLRAGRVNWPLSDKPAFPDLGPSASVRAGLRVRSALRGREQTGFAAGAVTPLTGTEKLRNRSQPRVKVRSRGGTHPISVFIE